MFSFAKISKVYVHNFLKVIGICCTVSAFILNLVNLGLLSPPFGEFGAEAVNFVSIFKELATLY